MLIKYPRTFHIPQSLGKTNDDKVLTDLKHFEGKHVTITEKMDGENTTMSKDKIFARSLDSVDHESRHFVKGLYGTIQHEIPNDWRICGENLFAKHSIFYENLESYFQVFNIWNEKNLCLSVEETFEYCELLGLTHTRIFYSGVFDLKFIDKLIQTLNFEKTEGFVIRLSDKFEFQDFKKSVAKFVRVNHVTTNNHWMYEKIIKNDLKTIT